MSKSDPRLEAFPVWAMGQVLLPVQFHALQQALLSQIAVRAELEGLPAYGVSRLKLREGMLENEGSVAIERLTYVSRRPFPVIDIPGNCYAADLNITGLIDRVEAEGHLPIYLHVLHESRDTRKRGPYLDDDAKLGREVFEAVLSSESTHDSAQMGGILLLELERENGQWSVGSFAPALICLGGARMPYLDPRFRKIQQTLRVLLGQIEQNLKDDYLSREHASEQRRIRGNARRVLEFFRDLGLGDTEPRALAQHPYLVYRELRDFLVDAGSNLEHPIGEIPAYAHDDLRRTFELVHAAISGLELTASLSSKSIRFERDSDYHWLDPLPENLAESRDVFLIIKFASENSRPRDDSEKRAFIDQFKLASSRVVGSLVTRSLPGVGLELLDETSVAIFAPKFGSGVMACRLVVGAREWRRVLEHGDLRIPITNGLDGLTLYLVWSEDKTDGAQRSRSGAS